jgi:hypothetical protein
MGDYYQDAYYGGDENNISYPCASWAPILGFMGMAGAVVFASELVSFDVSSSPMT